MAGRKSKFEEVQIAQRYTDLSVKAFQFLTECLNGKNKANKKWAVEQLSKGFVKMIPQVNKIGGDPDNQTPIPIYSAKSIKDG